MENVFRYYEFSEFFKDNSNTFKGNQICFSELNEQHFLVFEKVSEEYNLYISKYLLKQDIGVNQPEIIELLVKNYDKSLSNHRVILRQYLF